MSTINDTAEVRVNSTTLNDQSAPAMARLGGGYVIAWQSQQAPADYASYHYPPGSDLYMQRYDDAGNAIGAETHVNTVAIYDQVTPVIAATADGGYTVAWASQREHGMTSFDYGIYFQRFDSAGNAVGAETQANSYYNLDQDQPSIASLSDGQGFVVTWWSDVQSATPPGLYMRRFGADGSALTTEARIGGTSTGALSNAVTAALTAGAFVIAWDGPDGVFAQRFGASGAALGAQTHLNASAANGTAQPAVTALHDGGYVVAWQAADADGTGIHVQRFAADGSAVGTDTVVNVTTAGDQSLPTLASLDDGGFVVGWSGPDGSGSGVFAQRFDASGHAAGNEVQLNTVMAGEQSGLALAGNGHGGYVATWTSAGQDGSGKGVYSTAVTSPASAVHVDPVKVSASGIATGLVGAPVSAVVGFAITGGDVSITTAQGTEHFANVERIQFNDALFALDTQAPGVGTPGGHVWQAEALLWVALGHAPDVSLLSEWTAAADHTADMASLGQSMIDTYAPGVPAADLFAYLYTNLVHTAPSADVLQALLGEIGPGRAFETEGDLFALAAGLSLNTSHFADIVGTVQPLDATWFVG